MKNPFKKIRGQASQSNQTFLDSLQLVADKAKASNEMTIREIFRFLSGKGYAALLILLSLPFCLPITIPGFSTIFGILLGFLGLRIAFAKRPWWPQWILNKSFKSQHIETLTLKTMKAVKALQKVLHPRLTFLTTNPLLHRIHGLLVFVLAVFLSLPLPIPFTNMLSAIPIFFIGLGLLEDDGVAILIGYFIAFICVSAFAALFYFGQQQIAQVFMI